MLDPLQTVKLPVAFLSSFPCPYSPFYMVPDSSQGWTMFPLYKTAGPQGQLRQLLGYTTNSSPQEVKKALNSRLLIKREN